MQSTISQMKEENFPMTGKDSDGTPCYTQNDEGKVIDENERYWYNYQNRMGTVDFGSGLRW